MNKTLKAIATLSILFFLGSCTENNYNTTNNLNPNQEELDTALFGFWKADNSKYADGRLMNATFTNGGSYSLFYSFPDNQWTPYSSGEWYIVGELLHFMPNDGSVASFGVAEYVINNQSLKILQCTDIYLDSTDFTKQ